MIKTMKEKMTMFITAMLFVLALAPAVKAEASVYQTTASKTDATITWNADSSSYLKGWIVYVNGQQVTTLAPNVTSYKLTGLTEGNPYAVQVYSAYKYSYSTDYSYYSEGKTIVRTTPSKVKTTDVIWKKTDYIEIYAQDPNIYTVSGNNYKYADGFEIIVKDKNGKKKKTFDSYNSTYYGGADEYFKAPSALKNKGMQYTVRAYIKLDNGTKVYGEAVTKVAVPQAKITGKIKSVGGGKYKVTWKKISGASGYTIYRTSNEGKSFKKVKKVGKNTTSITIKKSYMNSSKKGIVIVANGVKIGKKKYNSIKSYYTYTY